MTSPICTVNGSSTLNGVNVTAGSTVAIALADTAGVKVWSITCYSTDELLSASTITAGLTISNVTKTATFTAPGQGSAVIFKSVVNGGKDANGVVDPRFTTTFAVFVLTPTGLRVGAFDERLEGSAQFGWTPKVNGVIRNASGSSPSAGAGLTLSGSAYNIGQNADGSIVVNADDLQLKPAFSSLLNGATSSATNGTLALRAATTSFAGLACTDLAVSGNATVAGTFGVTGASSLRGVTAQSTAITGTLSVTGASTLGSVGCTSLSASGNASVGGTLSVTGATTLSSLACSSSTNSGNTSITGTLGVTGATTLSSLGVTGTTTLGSSLFSSANVRISTPDLGTGQPAQTTITSGSSPDARGGAVAVQGGTGTGTAFGGDVSIRGGVVTGSGRPGDLTLAGPVNGVTIDGGFVANGNFIKIPNNALVPGLPAGGGVMWVQAGALMWKGPSGTVTTIAPA